MQDSNTEDLDWFCPNCELTYFCAMISHYYIDWLCPNLRIVYNNSMFSLTGFGPNVRIETDVALYYVYVFIRLHYFSIKEVVINWPINGSGSASKS